VQETDPVPCHGHPLSAWPRQLANIFASRAQLIKLSVLEIISNKTIHVHTDPGAAPWPGRAAGAPVGAGGRGSVLAEVVEMRRGAHGALRRRSSVRGTRWWPADGRRMGGGAQQGVGQHRCTPRARAAAVKP
jgi:hypothetical protein